MKKLLAFVTAAVGTIVAATSTTACLWLFLIDEPEMPKSMIER